MSDPAPPLSDRRLAELLAAVTERRAAPGGGSVVAIAAALGAALAGMAAAYAEDRAARETAAELLDRALALAEAEMTSYAPVLEAEELDASDPQRPVRLADALASTGQTVLDIAVLAADAGELAMRLAREGNPRLVGDALAGALTAEAACRAALRLAEIDFSAADRVRNPSAPDPRFADIAALAARAGRVREEALG